VHRALERKGRNQGLALEVAIEANCPEVFCDPEKIARVVINLAVNAIKFSPRSGHVWISARHEPDEAQVRIAVRDEGPGIAPEERERIFERFHRLSTEAHTSTNGFGLGLSIVKELVELSFGQMHLESEVGRGSVFSFTVPTHEPSALLRRYFRCLERAHQDAESCALVRIGARGNIDPDEWAELETFLETQVRRSDLLLKAQWNQWFLVCPADERGAAALVKRLEDSYREAAAPRSCQSPHSVVFESLGVWRTEHDREGLIACFETARADDTPGMPVEVVNDPTTAVPLLQDHHG